MQQTSLEAYWSLTKAQITKSQKRVYEILQDTFPACNRQVAERGNLPINTVTPRMQELRKKGMVIEAYKAFDITGKRVIYWKPIKQDKEYGDVE